jgi:hypothetical protein
MGRPDCDKSSPVTHSYQAKAISFGVDGSDFVHNVRMATANMHADDSDMHAC